MDALQGSLRDVGQVLSWRVFRVLLAHPLVGQVDAAEKLSDRMIDANTELLSWAQ